MNTRLVLRQLAAVLVFAALVFAAGSSLGLAQSKKSAAPAVQQNDADYTAEILKFTTEKFFLTDLVDHLPASATVPSPKKVLGYSVGTEGKLTYTKDIYRYYRELAKASPRVKVWTAGKSEEGREFLLVAVTDESNIAQLDKFKQITAKLADPRRSEERRVGKECRL